MSGRERKRKLSGALALAVSGVCASVTPGATKHWNTTSANWTVGPWSPTGVPAANDVVDVIHTNGTARTVTLNASTPTLASFSIGLTGNVANANTLAVGANTLSATNVYVGGNDVATAGNGVVNITAGTVNAVSSLKIWNSGTSAVNLSGGTLVAGSVDTDGTPARFNWTSGTLHLTEQIFNVDDAQSFGPVVNITEGKTLIVDFLEAVGVSGNGTLAQSGGVHNVGVVDSNRLLILGDTSGAHGTYLLSGGSLTVNGFEYIGNQGMGTFVQTGGTNTVAGASTVSLGVNGGSGTYHLLDGTLNVTGGEVVGEAGYGQFNHGGGTNSVTGTLDIAANAGASGTYNLIGAGVLDVTGNVSVGGTYPIGGGGSAGGVGVLNVSGGEMAVSDTLRIHTSGIAMITGGVIDIDTVVNSGTIQYNGGQLNIADLQLVNGGRLVMGPTGGFNALRLESYSFSSRSYIDIADNKLVVASPIGSWNGSSYTGVIGLVQKGRGGGLWDGLGITTSMEDAASGSNYTTIGVATATDVLGIGATDTALWSGQTVSGSDTLVMYTYGGDANLSGFVDIDDYGQIDFNASTGGSLTGWINGDFDYNGIQDIDDYGVIDFVINIQGSPFPTASGMSIASVPEPTAACGFAMFATALFARRRVRR